MIPRYVFTSIFFCKKFIARCVFVYTNFTSLISRDDLAFFAKRGKTAELVFLFEEKTTRFSAGIIFSEKLTMKIPLAVVELPEERSFSF